MKNLGYAVYDYLKKKQLENRLGDFKIADREEVSHYEIRKSIEKSLQAGDIYSDFEKFEKNYDKTKK